MSGKKIAIVGGGYAGFEIARELEAHADVTLIEQRDAFVHPPAAIRALVEPAILDQIILPYDQLLKKGRVVQGRATSISDTEVTLESGATVPADIIVVATGSSYAAPFKPAGATTEDFRRANQSVAADLDRAESVAIVGAGAVGTELAGEIAAARPEKTVTLISSDDRLFPAYPTKFGKALQRKLERLGVTVVLGQRAQDLKHRDMPYKGAVTLTDGRVVAADLVFPVIGSAPQVSLLETLPGVRKGVAGRLRTDKWLRPSDYPNVFVAGDIADTGDGMTIVAISRQNPWIVKTLKKVLAGAALEDQKPYTPWRKAPILVPLGPEVGQSWIFATLGDWVTRAMKGRALFIPKYRKAFGLAGVNE